jgi:hypothetical protein
MAIGCLGEQIHDRREQPVQIGGRRDDADHPVERVALKAHSLELGREIVLVNGAR